MLNSVSRSRSDVGLSPSHVGDFSVRPRNSPATILIQAALRTSGRCPRASQEIKRSGEFWYVVEFVGQLRVCTDARGFQQRQEVSPDLLISCEKTSVHPFQAPTRFPRVRSAAPSWC